MEETNDFVENGTHEVYVNTAFNDGSDIAELMQYFVNSSGYHDKFKAVCNRVNYLKEVNEGVNSMSSVIERYAEEYAQQYHEERANNERKNLAAKLITDALYPLNKIAELTGLSEQEVENLKQTIA